MHELPEAGPQQRSRNPRVGTFHAPDALCLRQHIGQAQDEAGLSYEVSICPGGSPHVISRQSGRQWTLSWDELVKLAIGAGIDAPYPGLAEVQTRGPSAAPHAFVAPAGNASPTYCAECGQYPTHGIHNPAVRAVVGEKPKRPAAQLAPPEGLVLRPDPATTRVAAVVAGGGAVLEAGQPIPPHPFGAEKDAPPQGVSEAEAEALRAPFTGREITGDLLALHETLAEYGVQQARCTDEACEICGGFDRRLAAKEGRPPQGVEQREHSWTGDDDDRDRPVCRVCGEEWTEPNPDGPCPGWAPHAFSGTNPHHPCRKCSRAAEADVHSAAREGGGA